MKSIIKKTLFSAVIVSVLAVSAITFNLNMQKDAANLLTLANVEALADGENSNPNNYNDCLAAGGNWNMATICQESDFESATCKVSGKISVFGVEISGSYEKGKKYSIPWARYKCETSTGNCCVKQGLYTGEVKLA